ncbi:Gmad2 immunoglobulin-like domain-containing protein [Brevibacillus sp. H7]|uniref:Gmad2 immunoglobulin-like domain-containing protein n=1 Tax=Brevibacillus sp. H7 TaxID=3349138 RepID=UPI00382FEF03
MAEVTKPQHESTDEKGYENESFRNLTVSKTAPNQYVVQGEARVMEGNICYVVADGQQELINSFVQASAGGLGWGKFEINLNLPKTTTDTLTLVLFEESAAKGHRIHQLHIPLR